MWGFRQGFGQGLVYKLIVESPPPPLTPPPCKHATCCQAMGDTLMLERRVAACLNHSHG